MKNCVVSRYFINPMQSYTALLLFSVSVNEVKSFGVLLVMEKYLVIIEFAQKYERNSDKNKNVLQISLAVGLYPHYTFFAYLKIILFLYLVLMKFFLLTIFSSDNLTSYLY